MTTITLASFNPRALPRLVPDTRWRIHELAAPSTHDARSLEALERVHAALTVARLLIVACLGAGAMVAGSVIGRL